MLVLLAVVALLDQADLAEDPEAEDESDGNRTLVEVNEEDLDLEQRNYPDLVPRREELHLQTQQQQLQQQILALTPTTSATSVSSLRAKVESLVLIAIFLSTAIFLYCFPADPGAEMDQEDTLPELVDEF